jgi:hypothetical protein
MRRTDMHNTRLRRANDAVLTEMARSLLREDRSVRGGTERRPDPFRLDASAGQSAAAEADRFRHTARRFRREAGAARHRPRPLTAPPA